MMLGGIGAPMFLFLAGIAVVLSAESKFRRTGDFEASWRAVRNRGWQVFGLAFLFRLQSYVLSGFPSAASLLKVDILNIMGPSIAMAAIAGRLVSHRWVRGVLLALVALGIAMLTPIVRMTPLLNWLPDPVEWYFRPFPGRTNFTLFPWAGFVFAGAAVGVAIDASRTSRSNALKIQIGIAATAILVTFAGYRASFLPSIYTRSDFWTSSPTFFLIRTGILLSLIPLFFISERGVNERKFSLWRPLELFGKSSLFVYWVHVEMVYGFFSRPLRRSLSLGGVFLAFTIFTVFLLGLVVLKNRLAIYLTDSKSVI
jgi:uncharacterized membrane protein